MHIFFLSQGGENAKCLMHPVSLHQAAGDRSAMQFAFCTHIFVMCSVSSSGKFVLTKVIMLN